jgi:hypothetical protein
MLAIYDYVDFPFFHRLIITEIGDARNLSPKVKPKSQWQYRGLAKPRQIISKLRDWNDQSIHQRSVPLIASQVCRVSL